MRKSMNPIGTLKLILYKIAVKFSYYYLKSAIKEELILEREYYKNIMNSEPVKEPINKGVNRGADVVVYENLHKGEGYSEHNWGYDLLEYTPLKESQTPFELASGNARFTEHLNRVQGKKARGLDLINPTNSSLVSTKGIEAICEADLLDRDLIISADFLEHLNLETISPYLSLTSGLGMPQLHMIACYDDFVSHQSLYYPHEWALIFRKYYTNVEILDIKYRRPIYRKKAVIIYAY
jgi:hypothetical protein